MPARITALFAELETKLKTLPAYVESANQVPITFGTGRAAVAHQSSCPRIVWVPRGAAHQPPQKTRTNPRQILTRVHDISCVCWGGDINKTEQLVHDLLAAMQTTAWGSIEFKGEEWPDDQEINLGVAAVVNIAFRIPVEAKTFPTIKAITVAADATGAVPGDGTIEWSEP